MCNQANEFGLCERMLGLFHKNKIQFFQSQYISDYLFVHPSSEAKERIFTNKRIKVLVNFKCTSLASQSANLIQF